MKHKEELLEFLGSYLQYDDELEETGDLVRSDAGERLYPWLASALREAWTKSALTPQEVGVATNRYLTDQAEVNRWLQSLDERWFGTAAS